MESEFFGYRKGAFSGATEDRPGLVRSADKGTLFLDEIGDLPVEGQATLLRVLQEREVLPVGGVTPIPVDVRVVAATHRDLNAMVEQHRFRADLLARLTGFVLVLPPLRERREDLGGLVRRLMERHAAEKADTVEFSPRAIRALFTHPWPGNVRELDKVLSAALIFAREGRVDCEHLDESLKAGRWLDGAAALRDGAPVDGQRDRLMNLLSRHAGNVTAVAAEMRTSRTQVHRLCRRFGVALQDFRSRQ
jgi:transcriptional regulator with PAS, ATPase and Fis domain